ncbi:hypothetical protein [Roseicyclus sp.]|uniref:hypothetical protein n=1 Tax=Roseicyclus sp. TaxID=1914329 RepID=UPI002611D3A5|nr:hypothetical protein [Roseicyclus sp.]
MPDDMNIAQKHVTLIPTDHVILNPRVRNRRNFEEMVENIAKIGLKRPITVAQRAGQTLRNMVVCGKVGSRRSWSFQRDAIRPSSSTPMRHLPCHERRGKLCVASTAPST